MSRNDENSKVPAVVCRAVVIWIDWYAYHLARFEGLQTAFGNEGQVVGIELVGGTGVHAGLKFREERPAHLPIVTLAPNESWGETNKLRLARQLWRKLDELKPEVVLVPGYYTLPAIAAALWARVHRRGSVLMTESTEWDHKRSTWKELLKSFAIRILFNWAVLGGKAHARYLLKLGFSAERIRSFYDVVGNARIAEAAATLRAGSQKRSFGLPEHYFLFVGRLAEEKNVRGLLNSWIDYRDSGGKWSLVLAGDGPEASDLQALAASSRWSSDAMFAGHKTAEQLLPYFSFASCFVLPSTREPWGLVVNEAMAASLPVIVSSRCGCAEDLVTASGNGLIFDVSEPDELTMCLHAMEQRSADELAAMGDCSFRHIQSYSPVQFGREIADIFGTGKRMPVGAEISQEKTA